MKVMKSASIPAKTISVLDHVKCELCDRTSKREDWSPMQYDVDRPELSLEVGHNYPEDRHTKITILDICPDCFRTKLIPWFESLGGVPRIEEE